ncbi:MAG TPA: hypothetical protein VES95_05260, partial [Dermatophilaceae bacterium]|nr:hypothetical protein [Dermatophilaceae bacterium]
LSPTHLAGALRSGQLRPVTRGAFVDAAVWEQAEAHQRYVLTVAGVLRLRRGWAASHHAAAALHGLPLFGVDLGRVDVSAPVTTSKRRGTRAVHRSTSPPTQTRWGPAVPAALAAAQVAATAGVEPGLVVLDPALKRGLCTTADVAAHLDEGHVRYGEPAARTALGLADPTCESPGESRTRFLLRSLGFVVRTQVTVRDPTGGFVARVDFLVGDQVVVEFDGAVKYAGADGRDALVAEKLREDRLRALGYRVVRLTWVDLERPERVAHLVRNALAAAS